MFKIGSNMSRDSTVFGALIRKRRLELGMSQVMVAKKINIRQNQYSRYETGEIPNPTVKRVNQLARVLRLKPSEIILNPAKRPKPKTDLGRLVHMQRLENGFTIKQFVRRLNGSKTLARRLEFGRGEFIDYKTARLLASALKLKPNVLSKFIYLKGKVAAPGLGKSIREFRIKKCQSGSVFAKKLGITRQYLSQIEIGKYDPIGNEALMEKIREIVA